MSDDKKYIKYKIKYLQLKNNLIATGGSKTKDNTKEIYIIRHGETEWNKLGKGQGQEADIELNDTGKTQATNTGKYFKKFRMNDKDFDCMISSPMIRCKQTSEMIANEIGINEKDIILNDEIKEVKKGNMSGLTKEDDIMKKLNQCVDDKVSKIEDPIKKYEIQSPENAEIFFQDIVNTEKMDITGVESKDEIIERTNKFIEFIKENECKKIIIVSHGGFIEILLKKILRLNVLPKGKMEKSSNCSICYLTFNDNLFSLVSPQNTEHLDNL